MGLLDDAIREHLDLKRRRGADPAEVERDEREALGPVRRPPAPGSTDAAEGMLPYDAQAEEDWDEAFGDDEQFPVGDATRVLEEPAPRRPQPSADPGPAEPDPFDQDLVEAEEPLPGPEPESPEEAPAPHPSPSPAGDETVEYKLEEERAEGPHADDVLEETPEFLQDAPDHDRLWFEQRPPRDFDFDG